MEYTTEQWREALQRCTPMGSEFTTPEACVQFVEEERTRKAQVIVRFKRERDAAIQQVGELKECLSSWLRYYIENMPSDVRPSLVYKTRQLLDPNPKKLT